MWWKQSKEELIANVAKFQAINEMLEGRVASLESDKLFLSSQIEKLQSALFAQRSPEYYRDVKADSALADPFWKQEAEKQKTEHEIVKMYTNMVESEQIIKTKDDLAMVFAQALGSFEAESATPENSES